MCTLWHDYGLYYVRLLSEEVYVPNIIPVTKVKGSLLQIYPELKARDISSSKLPMTEIEGCILEYIPWQWCHYVSLYNNIAVTSSAFPVIWIWNLSVSKLWVSLLSCFCHELGQGSRSFPTPRWWCYPWHEAPSTISIKLEESEEIEVAKKPTAEKNTQKSPVGAVCVFTSWQRSKTSIATRSA